MANKINKRLTKVSLTLDEKNLANEAYKEFVRVTPVRGGNARRSTRLKGTTIDANYPYAQRLDEGYSKQAPEGMSQPTIEYIRDYIYEKLRIKV